MGKAVVIQQRLASADRTAAQLRINVFAIRHEWILIQ